ncbi:MAG: CoA transferase [Mycobacterium sp.]|nr:CoA transferase [Mycobacterium sp.]
MPVHLRRRHLGVPISDGYLAIAMNNVPDLGWIIGLDGLREFLDPADRDRIEAVLADHLSIKTTEHWLNLLDPAGIWCAPVLILPELAGHDGFASLRMTQQISSRGYEGGP